MAHEVRVSGWGPGRGWTGLDSIGLTLLHTAGGARGASSMARPGRPVEERRGFEGGHVDVVGVVGVVGVVVVLVILLYGGPGRELCAAVEGVAVHLMDAKGRGFAGNGG
jgi:hypothetical protein